MQGTTVKTCLENVPPLLFLYPPPGFSFLQQLKQVVPDALWYVSQPLQVKVLCPGKWASFLICSQVVGRRIRRIPPGPKYFCAFSSVGLGFFICKNSRLAGMISKFPISLYHSLVLRVIFYIHSFIGRGVWIGAVDTLGFQNGEQTERTLN